MTTISQITISDNYLKIFYKGNNPIRVDLNRSDYLDQYINISLDGGPVNGESLLFDTGNSMLIYPYWEHLKGLKSYSIINGLDGNIREPWGCPAYRVKGPIILNNQYTINNCEFLACNDNNTAGKRTSNFGAGYTLKFDWNYLGLKSYIETPLRYSDCKYLEINFSDNYLNIYENSIPTGYNMMNILDELEWMSSTINNIYMGEKSYPLWIKSLNRKYAELDTGGGPILINDPQNDIIPDIKAYISDTESYKGWGEECNGYNVSNFLATIGEKSYDIMIPMNKGQIEKVETTTNAVICKKNIYTASINLGGQLYYYYNALIDYRNIEDGGFKIGFNPAS